MPIPTALDELTDTFRKLGAANPEAWARSQLDEGINQLHRYLFLRQAWSQVIAESDENWIADAVRISASTPAAPFSAIGSALARLLAAGAARDDLIDLVRGMQARLLFDICYLLEDPGFTEPQLGTIGWALVETDDEFEPTRKSIGGLHESVLETDPTGREMRPRQRLSDAATKAD